MIRAVPVALALALLVLTHAGCGSSGDAAPEAVPAEGEGAAAAEPADGDGTDEPASAGEGATTQTEQAQAEAGEGKDDDEDEEAFQPLEEVSVDVYFPSAYRDGLIAERTRIFSTASPVDRAKQILSDLISGPNEDDALGVLPVGTRLRQVYVLDDGIAWADFSRELVDRFDGGSRRELMAVYAIVDSLALNVPEIQRVGILVDGRPVDSLNGHVDLRRPLPPNRSLILRGALDEPEAPRPPGPATRIAQSRRPDPAE